MPERELERLCKVVDRLTDAQQDALDAVVRALAYSGLDYDQWHYRAM